MVRPRVPVLRISSKDARVADFTKAKGLLMLLIGGLPMTSQGPKVMVVWGLILCVQNVVRVIVAYA